MTDSKRLTICLHFISAVATKCSERDGVEAVSKEEQEESKIKGT